MRGERRGRSGARTRGPVVNSLLVGDGLVAAVAHAHLELEAHQGDGGALGRTLAAHGLATLPAVVLRGNQEGLVIVPGGCFVKEAGGRVANLSEANFLAVPHLLEVPEERLLALLTGVTVQPLWGLCKQTE